ncbi:Salicylate 5-hydroxylase, large oxygenase component [Paraburkholderia ribeironis]|uniref:Salicylate 5-hydroxylase, large oxygenase component n=1 Tax=Paraburkholderia ribeironis TaxID=1247936 RepID=A0A1N7RY84_9BURK|nr:Rieske 2Fe-2S domain-containing protein [Paraburkholderia ribeironis]SIT40092.1 Salicylate 5-hydroxylase, large oxygenase component [Paraburkholderia ribeironis]
MAAALDWKGEGSSRTPFDAYTSEALYQRELERLFYSRHWCYIGLEAEIPNPGDFRRTEVGERSVIMTRDKEGKVVVVENACAHRGMQFCRERAGNAQDFRCPYHQWNYDLNGNLTGVPFRRGVRQGGRINGGMPSNFDPKEHGLRLLRVSTRGGAVFASFDPDVESFEDFLGPQILAYYDRLFHGPKLTVLGYTRQRIPSNWKLMQENIKDPYHAGLLHTWFVNFGLWRADNPARLVTDARHRHGAMISIRSGGGGGEVTRNVTSFKERMTLHDDRFLDVVHEPWWGEPTVVMLTLMPSVIIQQQVNALSTRRIRPSGPGVFDYVWTHFGFETDDDTMTRRRLRQANLFGPAGFVSADDGEVIECVQQSFAQVKHGHVYNELGGQQVDDHTDHMVSETLVRGMYQYWREVMEAKS